MFEYMTIVSKSRLCRQKSNKKYQTTKRRMVAVELGEKNLWKGRFDMRGSKNTDECVLRNHV